MVEKKWLKSYELIAEIGQGGMGVVHLARQTGPAGFERLVVIKVLRPEALDSSMATAMFLDEARLTARLVHPNIAQTYELGVERGAPHLVMEYVHGRSLRDVLDRSGFLGQHLPLRHALSIAIDVCRALYFAHTFVDERGRAHRIIHRDIKPRNILLSFGGHVKLIDFGLAKSTRSTSDTAVGLLKGTPAYMSPEQAEGSAIDHRSDVFSLGIVAYEMVTGRNPFQRKSLPSTLAALLSDEVASASSGGRPISDELDATLAKALARSPDRRFQSARDFQSALEHCLESLTGDLDPATRELQAVLEGLFPDEQQLRIPNTEEGSGPAATKALSLVVSATRASDAQVVTLEEGLDPTVQQRAPIVAPLSIVDDLGEPHSIRPSAMSGAGTNRRLRGIVRAVAVFAAVVILVVALVVFESSRVSDGGPPFVAVALDPDASGSTVSDTVRIRDVVDAVSTKAPDVHPDRTLGLPGRTRARTRSRAHPSAGDQAAIDPTTASSERAANPEPKTHGWLTISTAPAASIALGSIASIGRMRAEIEAVRGEIQIQGSAFRVSLRYDVSDKGIEVSVGSEPWSIVYPDGGSPHRTPLHGVSVGESTRRLELKRPNGGEMTIVLRYQEDPLARSRPPD